MASNYYEILGVPTSASTSNIRAAYRQRVKKYHPDTSDYIDSVTIFKQLKAGYDVLSNRERRSEYDQLGHDAYVEKHGGYTRSEIRDATETQIQIHSNAQSDATDDWQESQQYRLREQRTAAESGSLFRRLFNLVIQGRTPTSNGTVAFAIRIGIYAVLVSLIAFPVAVLVGGYDVIARLFTLSATVLIISRVIYLSGFEYLRGEYIKIDTKPESDAYTTYNEAVKQMMEGLEGIAADQGSTSTEVVSQNYLSEAEKRRYRRESMRMN